MMHGSYYPSPRGAGGGTSYVYTNGHVPNSTPRAVPVTMNGGPGFTFQKRHERIDWRRMASVDVNRVMQELDFATLQDVIMTVTFCDITAEVDMRAIDANFIKLFQLSQLIAEYLLHSQNYLTHSISLTQEKLQQSEEAHSVTRTEVSKVRQEVKKIKEECHKRKKMLKQQQNLIQAGANNYHKCPYCVKAFVHAAYLQSHLQRKHPEYVPPLAESEAKRQQESLEREIEGLKERLRLTESQMEEERKMMQQQITTYKESLSREDSKRLEELQRQQMESWKREQLESQRSEMERMQEMFMKELKEMNEKYSSSQLALEDLQSKYGKKSMLGTLQDEDELADLREQVKKLKKENEQRDLDLQNKLVSTQSSMREQAKMFKDQTKQMKRDHKDDMQELKNQLDQAEAALRIEREGGSNIGKKYEKQIQQLLQESKEQKKVLRSKEEEIKSLKARPPPVSIIPEVKPAVVSNTPVNTGQQVLQAKRLDLIYAQKSPAKPPPSPPAKKAAPILAQSLSSEEEEESDDGIQSNEEEGDISMKSSQELGDERLTLKQDLVSLLKRNLEKQGVPEGVNGITSNSLDNKMRRLKEQRQALARSHPHFREIRKSLKEDLERMLAERQRGVRKMTSSARPKSTSPKPRSSANVSKDKHSASRTQSQAKSSMPSSSGVKLSGVGHTQLSIKEPGRQVPPPVAPRNSEMPKSSSLKSGSKPPGSPARVSFDVTDDGDFESDVDEDEDDSLDDEEDESELSLDEDSPDTNINRRPAASIPASSVIPPQPAARGTAEGMDDDSDWDSEDVSELEEMSQNERGKGGHEQHRQQQQRQQQQGRSSRPMPAGRPKSPAIAQKAQKIEQLLSQRRSDHKPVGGVDLGVKSQSSNLRPDSRDEGRSPSPRIPTLPDASDEEDDDDDDSFAVSSLDGSNYSVPRTRGPPVPVPAPRQGSRPPTTGSRKSDTDMSNTYGTSMWGSSKGQGESGTAKSSLVSVTDFDDDDDLDLSDL
ncbi:zinc finger protein DZIP1L-like isoform X2 [Acanthaster planci]|uniref:Zinc finger protein DZIP1L-like isoform X2 n=1 Tax=Acanthaster planci TaxID=133434 RepID=A0A8B7Z1N5_ACAPL|nr:zinc finger protein DZIP1L-like isoform X2 [Acanthaster planci]